VNLCFRALDKFLPETRDEIGDITATLQYPYYPQTKILNHVFQELFHVYALEVYCGRFDDISYQTLRGLKDRNFQHFLSATRKILLFIGENDRYYRAWIGLAFILANREYVQVLDTLTREEFFRSYLEQWELKFSSIPESHFQRYKSEFLDMMLASHLPNLLRETIPKRSCPQSKR